METLDMAVDYFKREVKIKHRMLARKCHSDKWSDECTFDQKTGEDAYVKMCPTRMKNYFKASKGLFVLLHEA